MTSHPPKERMLSGYLRGHWGIKNRQHWILDVTFSEDASRIRKGNVPEIAGVFRRLELDILQRDTSTKENIRGKRLRAGWDERVLNAIYAGNTAV